MATQTTQPDVQQVWGDPDFQGLPMEEKRKVLTSIDPDFKGLPSDQQDQVLGVHTLQSAASQNPDILKSTFDALSPTLNQVATGGASTDIIGGSNQFGDMASRVANFLQNKPNQPGSTILQSASNRPDISATAASQLIPGVTPISMAARVAGTVGAAATNPNSSVSDIGKAGGIQAALEAIPVVGSAIAPGVKAIMSKLSGVDAQAIQKLFENPHLLFSGPTKEEAQQMYSSMAAKAGLSPEVSDNVVFGAGKGFVKKVLDALKDEGQVASQQPTLEADQLRGLWKNKAVAEGSTDIDQALRYARPDAFGAGSTAIPGSTVPTQTILDAKQTIDDLISSAMRQGETQTAKGLLDRKATLMDALTKRIPGFAEANTNYSNYLTRDQFLHALPMNANGTPSAMKLLQLKYLLGSGGGSILGSSPAIQGLATAAAGKIAQNPGLARTGVQLLRSYINRQRGQ